MDEMPKNFVFATRETDRPDMGGKCPKCGCTRADLAEKPAPDDAEVQEAIKVFGDVFDMDDEDKDEWYIKAKYVKTLIRAAQNRVKQNSDDHTQPVLQPVRETTK